MFCARRVEHALDGREELERQLRIDPVANAGRDRELARAGEVAVDAEAQVDQQVPVLGEAERRLHVQEEREHGPCRRACACWPQLIPHGTGRCHGSRRRAAPRCRAGTCAAATPGGAWRTAWAAPADAERRRAGTAGGGGRHGRRHGGGSGRGAAARRRAARRRAAAGSSSAARAAGARTDHAPPPGSRSAANACARQSS